MQTSEQSMGYRNVPVPEGIDLKEAIDRLRKEKNAVILAHYYQTGDIQDIGANNRTGFCQDLRQAIGIIEFVDIGDVAVALFCRFGVTDIVDTKTQAFGQVVKAVQLQFFQFSSPPYFASRCGQSIMQILW